MFFASLPASVRSSSYPLEVVSFNLRSSLSSLPTPLSIAIGDTLVSGTPLSPAEFDEEAFGDDESITASVEDEFEDTQAQLQGVLQLQDDAYFEQVKTV